LLDFGEFDGFGFNREIFKSRLIGIGIFFRYDLFYIGIPFIAAGAATYPFGRFISAIGAEKCFFNFCQFR
jgi:hypothetical protein